MEFKYNIIMRYVKYILPAAILYLLFWYTGNQSELVIDKNKHYLTGKEIKDLWKRNIIEKPSPSRNYFSMTPTHYFKEKTYIPGIHTRDTILTSKIGYYSESKSN